jgi:hypothetical protein
MVVQIITIFHNLWIDYYYLVGEIDIYNSDVIARQNKFYLYMTPPFKSYWKQNMKEILY